MMERDLRAERVEQPAHVGVERGRGLLALFADGVDDVLAVSDQLVDQTLAPLVEVVEEGARAGAEAVANAFRAAVHAVDEGAAAGIERGEQRQRVAVEALRDALGARFDALE